MNPFLPNPNGPSIIYDADPKTYHSKRGTKRGDKDFPMSRSELMRFDANPWEWVRNAPDKESKDMAWGSLLDTMVTSPQRLTERYAIYPETYPDSDKPDAKRKPFNLNSNWCKKWRDDQKADGKECVYMDDYEGARQACAQLTSDERISELILCSKRQVMILVEYTDKATGIKVPFRALLDFMPDPEHPLYGRFLADLKSTYDLGIYEWEKSVFSMSYHVQAATYLDVTNAALEREQYSGFLHVLSKSAEPYAVGRRMLSEEFLDLGREKYRRAMARYCECLATNTWPGIDDSQDSNSNPLVDGWRVSSPASWMI